MNAPPTDRIRFCADDYALAPGVGRAIRRLLAERRIDVTSVMVLFPEFDSEIAALKALGGDFAVGLHLTLTDHAPLGAMARLAPDGRLPSLSRLLALAFTGGLDAAEIAAEVGRQFDRLAAGLGRPPDFIDGHQHVQALPVVRQAVLAVSRRTGARLRLVGPPPGASPWRLPAPVKAATLAALGSPLAREAGERAMNTGLLGLRRFVEAAPYRALFRRWLAAATPGTMIMCHPGEPDDALASRDPVVGPRAEELAYLAGPAFAEDVAAAGKRIA
ncbi:MAG: ChbG/HpnK family deacetylase [Pseudomonadota bacterium]